MVISGEVVLLNVNFSGSLCEVLAMETKKIIPQITMHILNGDTYLQLQ